MRLSSRSGKPQASPQGVPQHIQFLHAQLKELLTGYGPIGIVWFDGHWEKPWTIEMGEELYRYVKARGREFGFAGRLADESSRYSTGMLIASSGARYFHCYHLGYGLMGIVDKKTVRSMTMVACGQGMDDLKIYRLLTDSIREALKSKDAARVALARQAEGYLKKIFAIWNADHTHASPPVPYLGWARSWGYDGFYDDWQERMARYAAELKGVAWPGEAK